MDYDDYEDQEAADLRAEDRAQRAANNRLCLTCGLRGTHSNGCPDAPEPEEQENDDGN